ncbi:MAG TPA: NADPH-dependent glutamate synthase [Candidatus Ornithoclostridium faecigallinarum]|nr:NADPH-dependent glutamate synthase [Candidatus Ornithoclostridium faecigallinarum]
MNTSARHPVGVQPAEERIHNFDEVSLGYDHATMLEEADRCLHCAAAPCRKGCPVGVNIPAFIARLKEDDLDGAVREISLDTLLPAICGRVCPQEKQCEALCVRKAKLGGSVSIGALERYVGDYALAHPKAPQKAAKRGKKVAVVGSGPSGLTCAADCAAAGFDVTVFEAFHKPGGVLVYGIPEFRLPKDKVVAKEIAKLEALGVTFRLNTVIGKTLTIDDLLDEFDAIFIGTGAGLPKFMGVPGENLNGVGSANEFLTRVNLMQAYREDAITPVYCGKKVAVIGAGNVAMDAARTARRMGADVTIVYRRGREEMPARGEEIEHAEEEGIVFELLTNPVEVLGEGGRVTALKCVRMALGEPDASGRRSPVPIEGSEFEMDVDQVIVALGTSPNPLIRKSTDKIEFSRRGTIVVDEETMRTSNDKIYAGGDAVTGAATVILAMGAGRKAAAAIKAKLG